MKVWYIAKKEGIENALTGFATVSDAIYVRCIAMNSPYDEAEEPVYKVFTAEIKEVEK